MSNDEEEALRARVVEVGRTIGVQRAALDRLREGPKTTIARVELVRRERKLASDEMKSLVAQLVK